MKLIIFYSFLISAFYLGCSPNRDNFVGYWCTTNSNNQKECITITKIGNSDKVEVPVVGRDGSTYRNLFQQEGKCIKEIKSSKEYCIDGDILIQNGVSQYGSEIHPVYHKSIDNQK